MKKFILTTVSFFCVAVVVFSLVSANSQNTISVSDTTKQTNVSVVQVANTDNSLDQDKILQSRFLNMLNHNYAYGEDLYYLENIINRSVFALLDLKENDLIVEDYVSDYIFNMYGISDIDYSVINTSANSTNGYVYVAACGYDAYKHQIISVTENEDGTFTVKTQVTINSHNNESYTSDCETLFVRNEASQFGFNIIDCEILSNSLAI